MNKYYARFNSTDFPLLKNPVINDSSREVSFSDISIDFTIYDESLLPIQYQEITILKKDEANIESVLCVAYASDIAYPEFKNANQRFIITISLLSPYAYASKRVINVIINAEALNVAILTVLAPLIADGFTVEQNNLTNEEISEIFRFETVEKILNYLANKYDFVWHIDKEKKIYLINSDILNGQQIATELDETNQYITSIKPIKAIVGYANKLNVKNMYLINGYELLPIGTILTQGETYSFPYPISISENVMCRLNYYEDGDENNYSFWVLTDADIYSIAINISTKAITYSDEIGFSGMDDDNPSKKILLITDSSDTTKITGFKWNYSSNETISGDVPCFSSSTLIPINASFIDPVEISNIKSKLNTSGIIEKVIDGNGKYFTSGELTSYITNLFTQNNIINSEITLKFKNVISDDYLSFIELLKITKVIKITMPKYKVTGNYIITDTQLTFNTETIELTINARSYNINENFADIYRNTIKESSTNDLANNIIAFYNQDNRTLLAHEIIVNGEVVNSD